MPLLVLHFLPGQQQVLGHAPAQEGAGLVHGHDLQAGDLAPLAEGLAGGGDDLSLAILGDEDVENLTGHAAFGHLGHGQQDLACGATVQQGPLRRQTQDRQGIQDSKLSHRTTRNRASPA